MPEVKGSQTEQVLIHRTAESAPSRKQARAAYTATCMSIRPSLRAIASPSHRSTDLAGSEGEAPTGRGAGLPRRQTCPSKAPSFMQKGELPTNGVLRNPHSPGPIAVTPHAAELGYRRIVAQFSETQRQKSRGSRRPRLSCLLFNTFRRRTQKPFLPDSPALLSRRNYSPTTRVPTSRNKGSTTIPTKGTNGRVESWASPSRCHCGPSRCRCGPNRCRCVPSCCRCVPSCCCPSCRPPCFGP
jgi:hypothetical protein